MGLVLAVLALGSALGPAPGAQVLRPPTGGTPAGAGGSYRGPGDTVPDGGASPGGSSGPIGGGSPFAPGTVAGPSPGPSPGTLGGNPLGPPPIPPGLPDSPLDPPGPESPGGRPRVLSPTSWQMWWHYNRWAFVDPRSGQDLLRTSSGGFYLGRGARAQPAVRAEPSREQRVDLALPALLKAVASGGRAEVRIASAHALAKLRIAPGPDSDLPSFRTAVAPLLASGHALVTEKTLVFLGTHGDPSAYVPLASVLLGVRDARAFTGEVKTPWRWRAFAAYGLGLLGERNLEQHELTGRIFRTLQRAYGAEEHDEVRIAIGCAAARLMQPETIPRTETGVVDVQRTEQLRELLTLFENEPKAEVRAQWAPALGRLGAMAHRSLRARLIGLLLEPVAKRSRASEALQTGSVTGLGLALTAGKTELDVEARAQLARVAFESGTPRGTRFVARAALAQSVARRGQGEEPWAGVSDVRRVLLRALGRERGESLGWVALSLGILERGAAERGTTPDAAAMRALRQLLRTERSPDAAPAIALALGLAGDQESVPLIVERLEESADQSQRGYFALALGLAGAQDERHVLQEQLVRSLNQPFALEQTSIALALLGDRSAGTLLFEHLEKASNPEVQASLASSIGWSGDPDVLGRLLERLGDPRLSDADRGWTAVAIGRIVDEDRWPWVGAWSIGANYAENVPTRIEPDYRTGLLDLW